MFIAFPLFQEAAIAWDINVELVSSAFAACEIDEYGNEINCDGGGSGGGDSCTFSQQNGHPCGQDRVYPCTKVVCSSWDWLNWICNSFTVKVDYKEYCLEFEGGILCIKTNTTVTCPS